MGLNNLKNWKIGKLKIFAVFLRRFSICNLIFNLPKSISNFSIFQFSEL